MTSFTAQQLADKNATPLMDFRTAAKTVVYSLQNGKRGLLQASVALGRTMRAVSPDGRDVSFKEGEEPVSRAEFDKMLRIALNREVEKLDALGQSPDLYHAAAEMQEIAAEVVAAVREFLPEHAQAYARDLAGPLKSQYNKMVATQHASLGHIVVQEVKSFDRFGTFLHEEMGCIGDAHSINAARFYRAAYTTALQHQKMWERASFGNDDGRTRAVYLQHIGGLVAEVGQIEGVRGDRRLRELHEWGLKLVSQEQQQSEAYKKSLPGLKA